MISLQMQQKFFFRSTCKSRDQVEVLVSVGAEELAEPEYVVERAHFSTPSPAQCEGSNLEILQGVRFHLCIIFGKLPKVSYNKMLIMVFKVQLIFPCSQSNRCLSRTKKSSFEALGQRGMCKSRWPLKCPGPICVLRKSDGLRYKQSEARTERFLQRVSQDKV